MTWKLLCGDSRKPVLTVVQDKKYQTMWRVKLPDGTLTDMVNLSRAKDAATLIAGREGDPLHLLHWKAPC